MFSGNKPNIFWLRQGVDNLIENPSNIKHVKIMGTSWENIPEIRVHGGDQLQAPDLIRLLLFCQVLLLVLQSRWKNLPGRLQSPDIHRGTVTATMTFVPSCKFHVQAALGQIWTNIRDTSSFVQNVRAYVLFLLYLFPWQSSCGFAFPCFFLSSQFLSFIDVPWPSVDKIW